LSKVISFTSSSDNGFSLEHIAEDTDTTIPQYNQMVVVNQIRIEGTLRIIGTLAIE